MPNYLDQYRRMYRTALGGARRNAGQQGRLAGYDPREYAREAGRGIWREHEEEFGKNMGDLVSSQVGQGRVRSGPGFEDRDRYTDMWQENLANAWAGVSQQAAGQELQAAQLGQRQRERYYDLLGGGLDRETAIQNMRKRQQGNLFGSLGGIAGGIAGQFLLPGLGGELGSQMGAAAGRTASYF